MNTGDSIIGRLNNARKCLLLLVSLSKANPVTEF